MNETTCKILLLELAREVAWDIHAANNFNKLSTDEINYFFEKLMLEYNKFHEPTDDLIMNIGRCEGGINY